MLHYQCYNLLPALLSIVSLLSYTVSVIVCHLITHNAIPDTIEYFFFFFFYCYQYYLIRPVLLYATLPLPCYQHYLIRPVLMYAMLPLLLLLPCYQHYVPNSTLCYVDEAKGYMVLSPSLPSLPDVGDCSVLYPYDANEANELSIKTGDTINSTNRSVSSSIEVVEQ